MHDVGSFKHWRKEGHSRTSVPPAVSRMFTPGPLPGPPSPSLWFLYCCDIITQTSSLTLHCLFGSLCSNVAPSESHCWVICYHNSLNSSLTTIPCSAQPWPVHSCVGQVAASQTHVQHLMGCSRGSYTSCISCVYYVYRIQLTCLWLKLFYHYTSNKAVTHCALITLINIKSRTSNTV